MEELKHECGVAMIGLRKPLAHFQEKYGSWTYALNKMYLLLEKQRNRGQEGAGMACVKMNAMPGEDYMFRERAVGSSAATEIYGAICKQICAYTETERQNVDFVESHIPFAGERYMGHLRYSTHGKTGMSYVHPFLRRNNWRARNLSICGNFGMTNIEHVFEQLTAIGQHPRVNTDTYVLLEQLGHRLDRESERLYAEAKEHGLEGQDITEYIEQHIDVSHILTDASPLWDGGYVVCGVTGSGESFAMRDPWGIRTAFWYADDEKLILASERPAIQTVFNLETDDVHELLPGEAIIMRRDGSFHLQQILPAQPKTSACVFERIYFSRGSDADIYKERKELGHQLLQPVLKAIDYDVEHTVFSYIPNTAAVASYGLTEAFDQYMIKQHVAQLAALDHKPTAEELLNIVGKHVRRENVAIKDIKLRTFITEGKSRNDLAGHVYDITYGTLTPHVDNLVVIDDSIVRGTTLRESIIRILDRLHPKKLVIVSSCPQVRYPDYYGIDMTRMGEFIAFRTAVVLLQEKGLGHVITDVYQKCLEQRNLPAEQMVNWVKEIYEPLTDDEISTKMAELLRSPEVTTPIEIVFQSMDGLHKACPNHLGDWYFSGDFPTPGGVKLLNEAYIEYMEQTEKN